ncbi:helix-turn-helix domain-containing protein [Lewinella sp. JB7]|uniref:helix-turn-helix transcriptional regulator n=1 Tax=Lewinella sp. JB7 TaxID=2962887 RepID=UPI0020C9CB26|nr:helix-turn-helix domain-containing protein [Lewinella sp. JB7]
MNFLSSNIRFLRKRRKLSQQQLADDLGIKRSNIAAYETKNVEPRLSLINDMARYFSVPLEDMVVTDIASLGSEDEVINGLNRVLNQNTIEEIKEVSEKIQRMLDGFKVFYEFKREMNDGSALATDGDIDNFLVFINHMSEYNRLIENSLNPTSDSIMGERVDEDAHASSAVYSMG